MNKTERKNKMTNRTTHLQNILVAFLEDNHICQLTPAKTHHWYEWGNYYFYFGECFGVMVNNQDDELLECLLVEDDGYWYLNQEDFSIDWNTDIIDVLKAANKARNKGLFNKQPK